MEIRQAEDKDLKAIISLLSNDKLGVDREEKSLEINERYINAFEAIKKERNNTVYVAVEDDKVLGTFQLTFIQNLTYVGGIRAQMEGVRVHENVRGTGLG